MRVDFTLVTGGVLDGAAVDPLNPVAGPRVHGVVSAKLLSVVEDRDGPLG